MQGDYTFGWSAIFGHEQILSCSFNLDDFIVLGAILLFSQCGNDAHRGLAYERFGLNLSTAALPAGYTYQQWPQVGKMHVRRTIALATALGLHLKDQNHRVTSHFSTVSDSTPVKIRRHDQIITLVRKLTMTPNLISKSQPVCTRQRWTL